MSDAPQGQHLSNLLREERRFPPSDEFAAAANAQPAMYDEAASDRLAFWAKQAQRLEWSTPWSQVLDWTEAPFAKWFVDGSLNVCCQLRRPTRRGRARRSGGPLLRR